jgi:hypothetical protein
MLGLVEAGLLWKGLGWLCTLAVAILFLVLLFPQSDQPTHNFWAQHHKNPDDSQVDEDHPEDLPPRP